MTKSTDETPDLKSPIFSRIYFENRISMLQTCYNVSGNNHAGKHVDPSKITADAFTMFKDMLRQLAASERGAVLQVKTAETPKPKKTSRKAANALLKKVSASKRSRRA